MIRTVSGVLFSKLKLTFPADTKDAPSGRISIFSYRLFPSNLAFLLCRFFSNICILSLREGLNPSPKVSSCLGNSTSPESPCKFFPRPFPSRHPFSIICFCCNFGPSRFWQTPFSEFTSAISNDLKEHSRASSAASTYGVFEACTTIMSSSPCTVTMVLSTLYLIF